MASKIYDMFANIQSNTKFRNLLAFWWLGLTNNFAYVVMLSAAYDILKVNEHTDHKNWTTQSPPVTIATTIETNNNTCRLVPVCNMIGTGAILLADILPTLFIKLTAPFYMQRIPYSIRVLIVIVFSAASFPIVSTSRSVFTSILGVVCASISSGFGEITFLSLTAHYDKNVISTWSSGTGMAGVAGALSYLGLTGAGVSPRTSLLIMLIVPVLMVLSYFVVLTKPITVSLITTNGNQSTQSESDKLCDDQIFEGDRDKERLRIEQEEEFQPLIPRQDELPYDTNGLVPDSETLQQQEISQEEKNDRLNELPTIDQQPVKRKLSITEKLHTVKRLLKYMIPLGIVYMAEYFINQALYELLLFEHIRLSYSEQYRLYQVIYQVGVLISRSSVNVIHTRKTWIFILFQLLNVAALLLQIFFHYIPYIWVVVGIILWEGLLGGAGYVNTFYAIDEQEADLSVREFSQGITSVSDSTGIAISGFISIPVHNAICRLTRPC